jgi:hypothetical protein
VRVKTSREAYSHGRLRFEISLRAGPFFASTGIYRRESRR